MNSYDDAVLLQMIHSGDQKALEVIFERYRNKLFNFLFKVTKSQETAEEIVLDVFLKIWLGREIILQINNLEGFLFRVAHNKAIDFLRSLKREPLLQKKVWEEVQAIASVDTADHLLRNHIVEKDIQEALKKLPSQQQKAFHLNRQEGLTYDQIATELKLSRHTVRNHIAAALHFIRKYLHEKGYEVAAISLIVGNGLH